MPSHWADTQSLLQLSIGLNAAYYSISEFSQPKASEFRRSIATLRIIINDHPNVTTGKAALLEEAQKVEEAIGDQETNDRAVLRRCRGAAVACLAAGIVLLVVASFQAQDDVACQWIWMSAFLNSPVAFGVTYMTFISAGRYKDADRQRQDVQQHLNSEIAKNRAQNEITSSRHG